MSMHPAATHAHTRRAQLPDLMVRRLPDDGATVTRAWGVKHPSSPSPATPIYSTRHLLRGRVCPSAARNACLNPLPPPATNTCCIECGVRAPA